MNKLTVVIEGRSFEVEVEPSRTVPGEFQVMVDGHARTIFVPDYDKPELADWMIVNDRPYEFLFNREMRSVQIYSGRYEVQVRDQEIESAYPVAGDGRVKAPIPGLVTRIYVESGQTVEAGQALLVLEAMKMENEIRSPINGTVRQVAVKAGQTVALSELMLEIA